MTISAHTNTSVRNPFLNIRHLMWGFSIAIVLGAAVAMAIAALMEQTIVGHASRLIPSVKAVIAPLGIQMGMAIFAWYKLRQAKVSIPTLMGKGILRYNWLGGTILAIALMTFTVSFMAVLAYATVTLFPEAFAGLMLTLYTTMASQNTTLWVEGGMVLIATGVAPVVEEVTFRGLFFHCWSARRTIQTGLVLSAVLFASLHPQNFIGMFIFSLVMTLLYLRTRNLWVPIGIHAIYNGILSGGSFLALLSSEQMAGGSGTETMVPEAMVAEAIESVSQLRFGLTAIALLLITGVMIARFLCRNWPRQSAPLPYFQNLTSV